MTQQIKKQFQKPEMTVEELQRALFEANQQLRMSNLALQEQEAMKNEIFSNISHDLRSPLTALSSSLEYLLSLEDFTKEQAEPYLKLMTTKVQGLGKLINDIFLLTTLENASHSITLTPYPIGVYLEEVFFQYDADPCFSEYPLNLDLPLDFPYEVLINPENLLRLLDNLMQNAKKYSVPGSSITMGATIDTSNKEVILFVRDHGVGIPESLTSKIFQRTYTVSDARTPGSSGCGLGLSIASSIASLHGGHILCESKEKEGSTFYVHLPLYEH